LGMNRDESLRRPVALLPEVHRTGNRLSIYPSEPSGGTWIGFNDLGLSLALINWHTVSTRPENRVISRGTVVKALLGSDNIDQSDSALRTLQLRMMPPFRVVAIEPHDRVVAEFRWDQDLLHSITHHWTAQHWFSSGLDESAVQARRAEVCEREWKKSDAGSLDWLRALHQSHIPNRSSFSICMHGQNAATVSYTEIVQEDRLGVLRYHPGPLCENSTNLIELGMPLHSLEISRKP
jgi:Transport and Golgi organisation 2